MATFVGLIFFSQLDENVFHKWVMGPKLLTMCWFAIFWILGQSNGIHVCHMSWPFVCSVSLIKMRGDCSFIVDIGRIDGHHCL